MCVVSSSERAERILAGRRREQDGKGIGIRIPGHGHAADVRQQHKQRAVDSVGSNPGTSCSVLRNNPFLSKISQLLFFKILCEFQMSLWIVLRDNYYVSAE